MTNQILRSMVAVNTAYADKPSGVEQLRALWAARARCIADVLCLLTQLFGEAMPAAEAAFSLLGAALACLWPLFFLKEVSHGSLNPVIALQ